MASSSGNPSPLARFPADIRDAYQRFLVKREVADLQLVVDAALRDFLPKDRPVESIGAIRGELRLIDDLGFDSLAVAEIIFFFEDLFGVTLETQEVTALQTVADLRRFVERKLAVQGSAA